MTAWFWYAVGAAVLYGAHQIFTKLAADRISDGLGGFVVEATAALTILLYLAWLRFGGTWNQTSSGPVVFWSVLTGICVGAGTIFFFVLFQKGGPLSVVPMILAGGAAIMAIAGILFFKEPATVLRLMGIAMALACISHRIFCRVPIALSSATPLRSADEVRLPRGAKAHLVIASGAIELVEPKRILAGEEAARGRASTEKAGNRQRAFANATNALQVALFKPPKEISASSFLTTTRSSQIIPLYSPLGSTSNLKPLILWKSEPGKIYDTTITDEFDSKATPLRLSGVVPPIEFAKVKAWQGRMLAKDGLYRITLSETGNLLSACEYTFRTLKGADASIAIAPTEKLIHAYRILRDEPFRVGDALAELLTLPAVFAESELALRLKLYVFGQQGYREDFETVAAQLDSGNRRR